jgi:hypothetical protein
LKRDVPYDEEDNHSGRSPWGDIPALQRADSSGTNRTQTSLVDVEMHKVFENAEYVTFRKVTCIRNDVVATANV